MDFRVGQGYDVHALVPGRPLIIGGVTIPYERGLLGHSDADVLLHAITDALLGAAALGDIGRHFPDTDPDFAGANSRVFRVDDRDIQTQRTVTIRGLTITGGNTIGPSQNETIGMSVLSATTWATMLTGFV